MTDAQFENFKKLVYDEFATDVPPAKRTTLEIKIQKLLAKYYKNLSVDDYYDILLDKENHKKDWEIFVDNITVHKTSFFREDGHFKYVTENMDKILGEMPRIKKNKEIRVWCAASSTGEEPYTIAITLLECLPKDITIKILATDISEDVLKKAIAGVYSEATFDATPKEIKNRYFDFKNDKYYVKDILKKMIVFRKFNLTDPFPFKNTLDLVFCRNVMIYFDMPTKNTLIRKIYQTLEHNGLLFLGMAETLGNKFPEFQLVNPSVYKKR